MIYIMAVVLRRGATAGRIKGLKEYNEFGQGRKEAFRGNPAPTPR